MATTAAKNWRDEFLDGLRLYRGNIRKACQHANISHQSVYKLRSYNRWFDKEVLSIVGSYIDPAAPHRGPLGVREARGESV